MYKRIFINFTYTYLLFRQISIDDKTVYYYYLLINLHKEITY